MKAFLRTPWPTFGLGIAFAALGLAITTVRPEWRSGAEGVALCVPIFGGLALIAISPVLGNAVDLADARRRIASGVRWLGAWIFFRWAFFAVADLAGATFDAGLGPAGSPARLLSAFLLFVGGMLLPLVFAGFGAEAIRRCAAWLGEGDTRPSTPL